MIRSIAPSIGLLLLCCNCQPIPNPTPPAPTPAPLPAQVDAGAPDDCDRWALAKSSELDAIAAQQQLPIVKIENVFKAYCVPYEEDGADAAVMAGLSGARQAHAFLVDASTD